MRNLLWSILAHWSRCKLAGADMQGIKDTHTVQVKAFKHFVWGDGYLTEGYTVQSGFEDT